MPERLAQLRVLIVDDNATAREILQEPLSTVASRVDAVASGKEAIAAIQQHDASDPYDIVFMDWRMPGLDGLQASRHIKSDETLKHQPAIVLVTAFGREEVREEAERLKLDGFLVKPVTKSMIVDTLVNVFAQPGEKPNVAVETHQADRLRGAEILLCEDNEINQQIAIELLEGAGARVKTANNGREGVDILTNGPQPPPFHVVLMDLQMPEMDGHQATAKIRSDPRFANLPVIAMTAHATIEERVKCLESGMIDHISKPIDPQILLETVARYFKPINVEPASAPPSSPPEKSKADADDLPKIEGLNVPDGLSRVAGNRKLYIRLLRQFTEQQAPVVAQSMDALAANDFPRAEQIVHTLKGVAGNVGAQTVQALAGRVESLIRAKSSLQEMERPLQELARSMEILVANLKTALGNPAAIPRPEGDSNAAVSPAQSLEAATQLRKLLSEFDAGASDYLETQQAALRPLFSAEAWLEFEKLIQNYSFADAQSQLEEASKHLPAA